MLTYADAEKARTAVLKAYGMYLPEGLAERVRHADIKKIVKLLPEAQYEVHFSAVFCKFFASANVVAFGKAVDDPDRFGETATIGGSTRLIPSLTNKTTIDDKLTAMLAKRNALRVCNCPAFTSPAVDVMGRQIYLNSAMTSTSIGTLYHEFIHFLQHGNLYPEFYALGGANVGILEGITEYFTRRVDPIIAQDRLANRKYQDYFTDIEQRIGNDRAKRQALIRYCFQGEPYLDLGGVRPRL